MAELLLDFGLLALAYAAVWALRLRRHEQRYRVWFTLLWLYLCAVACVTLMPFRLPIPGANPLFLEEINLEPFRDIKRGYLYARSGVVLNCLMFLPFGFILPCIRRRGPVRVTLASLGLSLFIEGVQLLYCWGGVSNRRIFDVTDPIMNTAGAAAGYALFRLARPLIAIFDPAVPIKQKRKRTA